MDWLQGKGLEYYYVSFIQSEVTSLNDVRNLTVDENLFDEFEITLPGHKKRLRKAGIVKKLYTFYLAYIYKKFALRFYTLRITQELMFETIHYIPLVKFARDRI